MRYLAWFALPFCAAALVGCKLPDWRLAWLLAAVCALLFAVFLVCRIPHRTRFALLTLGACLGLIWFCAYTAAVALPAQSLDGKQSAFTAQAASYPVEQGGGVAVILRVDSGSAAGIRVQAYLDSYYAYLKPGDRLTGTASFTACDVEEDSYYYTSRGIFLLAGVEVTGVYSVPEVPLRYFPARLGKALKESIVSLFPGEEGALLMGLLTGDKSGLSDDLYSAFSRSGMIHLLAVSGLHVSFLCGILYLLPGQKRRRTLAAIPVMVCFALMTGGQPPVWRAVIMSSLLLLSSMVNRENDPPTSLAFALFLLLLQNPYAAESVGLQLSFAAVAGLMGFQASLFRWLMKPVQRLAHSGLPVREGLLRAGRFLAGGLSTSCSALVFSLPLSAWYFGTVSLVGPLANLLCVWAASLAFGLGLTGCAIYWLCPPLGELLYVPVRWLLRWLIRVARCFGRSNFAAIRLDNLYLRAWLVCLMAFVALVMLVKPLRRRPVLPISSAVLLLALALTFRMLSVSSLPLTASVLDVGQGACTVFCSEGCFVAVDCGGDGAGDALADYIQSGGGEKLSLLALTSYDSAHVSGVEELLERLEVGTIALPDLEDGTGQREAILALAAAHGCSVLWIDRTTDVSFGCARLALFPPAEGCGGLSALCAWEGHSVLITGDLSQEQEEQLLEREDLPELDVLLVGGYGGSSAVSARLLAKLSPDSAVISVGSSYYWLPSSETLKRLDDYLCDIYRTDRNGTVTFRFS